MFSEEFVLMGVTSRKCCCRTLLVWNIFLLLFASFFNQSTASRHKENSHHHNRNKLFLNEFSVHIDGNHRLATQTAQKHGFINKGQVGTLKGWYIYKDVRLRKRSIRESEGYSSINRIYRLSNDEHVSRGSISRMKVLSRPKRQVLSTFYDPPNDPSWHEMWYMHCGNGNTSTYCPSSMRVTDAWRAGYTGKGIVATILDDGIETTHPDLTMNYDPRASKDINEDDYDPSPRYDPSNENKHGTRCAGVVAAALGNRICSVGVAFKAKIGGIRMLDGDVTDKVEAESLNYARDHIDIYSASWGPDDDGATVEGPGSLAKAAFRDGAKYGRNGKGSIFVWASGNGGHNKDSCACDGYINSIYTIGISSVSQTGSKPWYLEACASTLATTYSSGETNEGKVITTDLHSSCTHQHTGTSASAPMAAGLIALMLQANNNLNWRDVQHIIVRTTTSRGLKANDWVENGAGFRVSHVFGFGLMDAAAMTHVASTWQTVPEQKNCVTQMQHLVNRQIRPRYPLIVTMDTDACHRQSTEVAYLEHVILRINLSHSRRGDLQIFLTSPSGTTSTILERRDFDRTKGGFNKWEFMTTHHWGENPMGVWELKIRDTRQRNRELRHNNYLREWQLIFFGTTTHPQPNFRFDNCDTYPQNLCHSECEGCCGSGNSQCKRCRNMQTVQGECIAACPLNYYAEQVEEDNVVKNICKPCSRVCRVCDGGHPNNCTACHAGFNIVDGTCEKTCSAGFYLTPEPTQTCRRCAEICRTCHKRSSLCTSCRDGFRFHDGDCRPSCPRGTYLISITSGCGLCNKSCEACTSFPYRCTSCSDGYVLHRNRCTKVCPKRHFPDFTKKICRPCAPTCKSCSGPKKNQCTKCMSNRTLRDGVCFPSPVCQDAYPVTTDKTNPCVIVLNRSLCHMNIFAKACCYSCLMGGRHNLPYYPGEGDYDDYEGYDDYYGNYDYGEISDEYYDDDNLEGEPDMADDQSPSFEPQTENTTQDATETEATPTNGGG